MQTTLYLIRHAQSHPSSDQHYSEWPLSTRGQDQARALAPLLRSLGIRKLYSSPYKRCLETIRPFTEQTPVDFAVEHHLGERVISQVLLESFEEVWARSWDDFDFALPGCETSAAAQFRFCSAIQKIVHQDRGSVLGVSSHGNVIALLLNQLDRQYSRAHADRIRNPDVFKIVAGEKGLVWDRSFHLPGLESIATPQDSTPIRYSTTASARQQHT